MTASVPRLLALRWRFRRLTYDKLTVDVTRETLMRKGKE